jgi:lipopolysaccharide exporter
MDAPTTSGPPAPSAGGLARQTVRAVVWTIATGLGTRLLGVVGTLIMTWYVLPYDYGEVSAAGVLVWTANQFSSLSVGTYILAHPKAGRDVMFHATVLHVGLGFLAYAIVLLIGGRLGTVFDAPTMGRYVPGIVLSMAIDRVTYMPERALVREMRFGPLSIARSIGEVAYSVASVLTAVLGWAGMSVVAGNLARSIVRLLATMVYVSWREWMQVTRLRWAQLREMIGFGLPIAVGGLAGFGVRRWDNLLVSRFFGPAVMGTYNLAYNLADIPAVQVGEQISDVLQAAFSRVEADDRRRGLVRSLALLSFVMTPMAVGLGCIAPSLAAAFFDKAWAGIGPMLMALAVISFTRPISNTVGAYLQIRSRQRVVAGMDLLTLAMLVGALLTLGRLSPLWACVAVGIVFMVKLLVWAFVLRQLERLSLAAFLGPMVPPILACLPMIAAVAGLHHAMAPLRPSHPVAGLVSEIVVGAAAYAGAALLVARTQIRDILALVRGGWGQVAA